MTLLHLLRKTTHLVIEQFHLLMANTGAMFAVWWVLELAKLRAKFLVLSPEVNDSLPVGFNLSLRAL